MAPALLPHPAPPHPPAIAPRAAPPLRSGAEGLVSRHRTRGPPAPLPRLPLSSPLSPPPGVGPGEPPASRPLARGRRGSPAGRRAGGGRRLRPAAPGVRHRGGRVGCCEGVAGALPPVTPVFGRLQPPAFAP